MPGRGAYICTSGDCWERGTARSVIEHRLHVKNHLSEQDLDDLRKQARALISTMEPNREEGQNTA